MFQGSRVHPVSMNSPPPVGHHGGRGPNCQDKCILKWIEFRDKAARKQGAHLSVLKKGGVMVYVLFFMKMNAIIRVIDKPTIIDSTGYPGIPPEGAGVGEGVGVGDGEADATVTF